MPQCALPHWGSCPPACLPARPPALPGRRPLLQIFGQLDGEFTLAQAALAAEQAVAAAVQLGARCAARGWTYLPAALYPLPCLKAYRLCWRRQAVGQTPGWVCCTQHPAVCSRIGDSRLTAPA